MNLSNLILKFIVLFVACSLTWSAHAMEQVYQSTEDFIAEIFIVSPPAKLIWLTKDVQTAVAEILGHAPRQLRQRYWSDDVRTLWILEEMGKEELITAGFVVQEGRIEQAKILAYRESRGMEVRYPAFLKQFKGAVLNSDNHLDRTIDGISGATLSVNAMQRMARVALFLDQLSRIK